MNDAEARRIIETEITPTLSLFISRKESALNELNLALSQLRENIERLPRDINWPDDSESTSKYVDLRRKIESEWPELGFYDNSDGSEFLESIPESIGDAVDDLSDIALDLTQAIEIAAISAVGALSQLRFWYDTHLEWHFNDLKMYLDLRISSKAYHSTFMDVKE